MTVSTGRIPHRQAARCACYLDTVHLSDIFFMKKGQHMPTTSMTIRMDSAVKQQAQELFAALGMDMTTAVNIFLRQAIQRQGLPFEVALHHPNRESLEALAEVREMKQHPERYKGYTDAEAMMKELLA